MELASVAEGLSKKASKADGVLMTIRQAAVTMGMLVSSCVFSIYAKHLCQASMISICVSKVFDRQLFSHV